MDRCSSSGRCGTPCQYCFIDWLMCCRCAVLLGFPLLLWLIFSLCSSDNSRHCLLYCVITHSGVSLPAPIITIISIAKKTREVEILFLRPAEDVGCRTIRPCHIYYYVLIKNNRLTFKPQPDTKVFCKKICQIPEVDFS